MSYIYTEYTKAVCVGKTIADIVTDDNKFATRIIFTDGTWLRLHPWDSREQDGKWVKHTPQIIAVGFHADGTVISG